ncbi:ABC transporter substrate-binding protein [Poseidonibacter lekithochrous]|uniref:ABC transporter substrate-binding protein n=1 Tax=Poseidonibacter lekithochrous TaxID=1904463 RepID=UPI000D3CF6C6|nr:ABC transporter substrate-binding protein [Poseidonibacter lekithochrous]
MKKKHLLIIILLILLTVLIMFFRKEEETVKIGFVGALTSKYSVLGNAMMNGVLLAFEEVDYTVDNKKIELLFKDDKKDIELNKKIVNDFIDQGIKIVIGNVTSSMSKVSMSIINNYDDMFMISASSASNEFTKKDDRFFRVHVANNAQRFHSFTKYIKDKNYKKVYGIYDPFNKTYTHDYLVNFEKSFISNGGSSFVKFSPTNKDLDLLVDDIRNTKPDIIVICANSVDAARVIQYLRLNKIDTQVASSEWAMTESFLENTGKTSEGVIFNIDYDEYSNNKRFKEFVKRYENKYKQKPSIFASKAYELSTIIIELLKKGDETKLKENLLLQEKFQGLQDMIVFDKYGDVIRDFITFEVKDGKYTKVQ